MRFSSDESRIVHSSVPPILSEFLMTRFKIMTENVLCFDLQFIWDLERHGFTVVSAASFHFFRRKYYRYHQSIQDRPKEVKIRTYHFHDINFQGRFYLFLLTVPSITPQIRWGESKEYCLMRKQKVLKIVICNDRISMSDFHFLYWYSMFHEGCIKFYFAG